MIIGFLYVQLTDHTWNMAPQSTIHALINNKDWILNLPASNESVLRLRDEFV